MGNQITFQYDTVYFVHGDSYSDGGRSINFDGINLESLSTLIEHFTQGSEEPICVNTKVFDVFMEDGKEIERTLVEEKDKSDERINTMLNMAVKDYLDPNSYMAGLRNDYVQNWIERKGTDLIGGYHLLFIMKILESIIRDGGVGQGYDNDPAQEEERICAKIYEKGADRYAHYREKLNYFQFSIPYKVWKASFDLLKAAGPEFFMLEKTMYDVPSNILMERVIPAFYYSLLFLKHTEGRVKDLFDYTFEMS